MRYLKFSRAKKPRKPRLKRANTPVNRVKQARLDTKLTQAVFAQLCGVSVATLQRYEAKDDAKLSLRSVLLAQAARDKILN